MISRRPAEYDLSQVDGLSSEMAKRASRPHLYTKEECSESHAELLAVRDRLREWKLMLKRQGKLRVQF